MAFVLAACGGDDDATEPTANSEPAPTTEPPATEPPTSTTEPPATEPPTTTGEPAAEAVRFEFGFETGGDGWISGVTDYTDATRPSEFVSAVAPAPPGDASDTGYFHIGADNPSDDVFVFVKRALADGIVPNTTYTIGAMVEFQSSAPSGCVGIGGAPGEAVTMKFAATDDEPVPEESEQGTRLSIDKGGQSEAGSDAVVIGDMANGLECESALEDDRPFAPVTNEGTIEGVTAGDDGEIWVLVGIDSGFEGRSDLYLDRIVLALTPT